MSEEEKWNLTGTQRKKIQQLFDKAIRNESIYDDEPTELVDYLWDIICQDSKQEFSKLSKVLGLATEAPKLVVMNIYPKNNKTILYFVSVLIGPYLITINLFFLQDTR